MGERVDGGGRENCCPQCGSTNIWEGNFPLECIDCGWHHLNKHPCDECGAPSVSGMQVGGSAFYGCKEHRVTLRNIKRQ